MKKQYLLGMVLFLALGLFVAFSGVKKRSYVETKPDQLFLDLIESTRYFSVEEVAQMIIAEDPSILLIDVRSEEFFNKFSLNGAINIPLKELFKEENLGYLDQNVYKTIFYSNGSSDADVAWIISNRMGFKNTFVMLGGLNTWVDNILQPRDNSVIWDKVHDQMYQYRRGASIYFGGDDNGVQESGGEVKKPSAAPIKRKKKEVEGGCS
ncbi:MULTISPECIES: rhodanese-like domain-containing protein [unclassified Lentimicrobium]|uniref:rhodanese-like domain-containing protein n=1 Tax=unclassified Lentimicrobium TaxID=2677434 RepID=UPI0015537B45|nr:MULTISPECIES: rhodanese-like domain-containing protein [unclassified Lentimicrobium]NPD45267.1 rhodanese-like domain-containing protein [Lentimicrobium sp. S6]NPD86217.1 rhodanese-like domain-containing protein [Lentimicrobium sp. L6]